MTKKQLRKAKRQTRKQEISKLTIVGEIAHYLGMVAFRIKNTGYGGEMDWNANKCVGIKYNWEVTEIYIGFHPIAILGYILFAVIKGFVAMWECLIEMPIIDKSTKKVNSIDYYDKNKKANG